MEKAAGAATAAPAGAAAVGLTGGCRISQGSCPPGQNLGQESHVLTKMGQKNRSECLKTGCL